jgi:transposase
MQIFLEEIASRHPDEKMVRVLDGTGGHASKTWRAPDTIRRLPLPAYAPELNPVEHLGEELREKFFNNLVFDSIDALENHLEAALRPLTQEHDRVHSIVRWP